MEKAYTVFGVDDDATMRLIIESSLDSSYVVETFDCGEVCLDRVKELLPDLFLLDIELPGLNGHDLCRQIRKIPEANDIPVVFISTHDDLETVVAGYDAGGDDYVVKPVDVLILNRKIENIRRIQRDKVALLGQAKSAEELATSVLANLGEYAVLIKFLRSLNGCDNPRALLDSLFQLLRGYRLDAAIQLRLPGLEKTFGEDGESRPLEVSVINHVRNMDRIFQFNRRAAYNFERITILVNNMPIHDPELCGRVRDNVVIAAECANVKLHVQRINAEHSQSKVTAANLLDALQSAVMDFERKYLQAHYNGSLLTQDLLDELATAFASLGLSEQQETRIDSIVRAKVGKLAETYDFSEEMHIVLNDIAKRLAVILSQPTPEAEDPGKSFNGSTNEPGRQDIELF
jgi:CheY-like chemotaxis protein